MISITNSCFDKFYNKFFYNKISPTNSPIKVQTFKLRVQVLVHVKKDSKNVKIAMSPHMMRNGPNRISLNLKILFKDLKIKIKKKQI